MAKHPTPNNPHMQPAKPTSHGRSAQTIPFANVHRTIGSGGSEVATGDSFHHSVTVTPDMQRSPATIKTSNSNPLHTRSNCAICGQTMTEAHGHTAGTY